MSFADMTRADRVAYFNFHGGKLDAEWAAFVAAVEKWSAAAKSAGAIAYVGTTAAHYSDAILDAAKNQLAEEVSEYLGPSTT